MKKIVFTSLCFVLCGILYVTSGFATKENVEVKAAKKAIDVNEIETTYTFAENSSVCIRTEQEYINWAYSQGGDPAKPPFAAFVFDGNILLDDDGKPLICNGTLKDKCTYGAEGYYYTASYGDTELAISGEEARRTNATVEDVATGEHGVKILSKWSNGCAKEVRYATILYVKCNDCPTEINTNYTITYHLANGSTSYKQHTYGQSVNLNEVTTSKDGYTFLGWYYSNPETDPNAVKATSSNINEHIDKIKNGECTIGYQGFHLYPKFEKNNTCKVVEGKAIYYDGDIIVNEINLYAKANNDETLKDIRTDISLAAPAEKPGFKFDGWYTVDNVKITNVSQLKPVGEFTTVDENNCDLSKDNIYKLYAKYIKESCTDDYNKTYKVYFYDDDKTTLLKQETKEYGIYPELFTPLKEGYIFLGWYTVDGTKVTDSTKIVISETFGDDECPNGYADVKLYAKYISNDLKIRCQVLNGKVYYYDDKGEVVKITDLKVKTDLDQDKVYYYVDNKLVETEKIGESLKLNDKVTFEEIPKEGYNFIGWYADAKYTIKVTNFDELDAATEKDLSTYVDEDKCMTSRFNYNVYAKYEKIPDNPDTGDMIFIYIALGLVLVAGSGIAIKKLMSSK